MWRSVLADHAPKSTLTNELGKNSIRELPIAGVAASGHQNHESNYIIQRKLSKFNFWPPQLVQQQCSSVKR